MIPGASMLFVSNGKCKGFRKLNGQFGIFLVSKDKVEGFPNLNGPHALIDQYPFIGI